MSTHIVHILQHGSIIGVDRGCLTCKAPDKEEKRLPLSDILAVIVAARGVCFSGESLARLLQNDAIILHCNEKYQPIGQTIGLSRLVHIGTFENQIKSDERLNIRLWNKLLFAKISNQAYVLDLMGKTHKINEYIQNNAIDEGNIARHYWSIFFRQFGRKAPKIRVHRNAQNPVNGMLNYAYAVLSSFLHRSIIAHGLNPVLGIHHKYRFRSNPLVYDLLEPLRPLADLILLRYHQKYPRKEIETFVRHASKDILEAKISFDGKKNFSLISATDIYIASIANFYRFGDLKGIKIPALKGVGFEE